MDGRLSALLALTACLLAGEACLPDEAQAVESGSRTAVTRTLPAPAQSPAGPDGTPAPEAQPGRRAGHQPPQTPAPAEKSAEPSPNPEAGRAARGSGLRLPDLPPLRTAPGGRVVLVPDGDTLRLADRRTVRLACIDAPDLAVSQPTRFPEEDLRKKNFRLDNAAGSEKPRRQAAEEQYFAREAQRALRGLCQGRTLTLRSPVAKKDRQGRLMADAVLPDGTSPAAAMVAQGLAYVVSDPDYPQAYVDALLRLQTEALSARRGFWGRILSLEAARQPWIGNTQTRLFYSGSDVRGQQIKPRQRLYFGTLLDAFSAGFAPAASRDFWPQAK